MSITAIESALQSAVVTMTPNLLTHWPNDEPMPAGPDEPYQVVSFLHAPPLATTVNRNFYWQTGMLQLLLCYPRNTGARPINIRAQLLRTTFNNGDAFTAEGVTVNVDGVPDVRPGLYDADRYCIPVRVPYKAAVFAG